MECLVLGDNFALRLQVGRLRPVDLNERVEDLLRELEELVAGLLELGEELLGCRIVFIFKDRVFSASTFEEDVLLLIHILRLRMHER